MSSINLERRGAVAIVTLNNPDARNALDLEMRRALLATFRDLVEQDEVGAVLLTGVGDAFCSGADVGKMGGRDLAGSRQRMKTMHAMIRAVHGLDKPVVAAVRGPAVGIGFSLAMACDVVIASAKSNFSQVFTKVGLAPDGGAIWFLARQMGFAQAKELVYSARRLGGDEAHVHRARETAGPRDVRVGNRAERCRIGRDADDGDAARRKRARQFVAPVQGTGGVKVHCVRTSWPGPVP